MYINSNSMSAFTAFTDELYSLIMEGRRNGAEVIVFVCIGTDRSTGDAFGPLVGYKLKGQPKEGVYIYGDLDHPVHAKNLDITLAEINRNHLKPFIIAIDACLGKMDHVGYISMDKGSIKPGSGVNKDLAPVGDMYITGIVNFGGFMDFLVLQNTRLSTVMKMADLTAAGIRYVLWRNERTIKDVYKDTSVYDART